MMRGIRNPPRMTKLLPLGLYRRDRSFCEPLPERPSTVPVNRIARHSNQNFSICRDCKLASQAATTPSSAKSFEF